MRTLLLAALVAAVLHAAGPLDALVHEVRAYQLQARAALTCQVAAVAALTSEEEAELDEAEALCERVR